jgi:cytochrome c oxidase cbb3-type subunit 3
MTEGLSWYITIVSLANVLAMGWLIWWSGKGSAQNYTPGAEMSHTWDGDLRELNNPLPRWWLWLFYVTIVFALLYLALYPGLGKAVGMLGWSQEGAYQEEVQEANAEYGPIFQKYATQDLAVVAKDPQAQKMGQRIYLNYCAMCHGADARGATGFPNLTDKDWLYGGDPKAIKATILQGRNGVMPSFGAALGDQGTDEVVEYVLKISGREHDATKAAAGEARFALCAGCHMPNGQGNQMLGAPNLTDNVWLYGASRAAIRKSVVEGRNGVMPAHKDFLGEPKVHLVAAYVLSLGQGKP